MEGHEQGLERPAIILSHDTFNHGPAELVVAVPLTKRHRPELDKLRVQIAPPEAGLSVVSYAMPEQIRTLSTRRLIQRWGKVSKTTLERVEDLVRVLLNL